MEQEGQLGPGCAAVGGRTHFEHSQSGLIPDRKRARIARRQGFAAKQKKLKIVTVRWLMGGEAPSSTVLIEVEGEASARFGTRSVKSETNSCPRVGV